MKRLVFRPLPGFTIVFAAMFALLMALGVWQIQRLHWKLGLIAEADNAIHAPPVPLEAALKMGPGAQYRHVILNGRFLNAKEAYVYTTGPDGEPVYHVLVPFETDEGVALIVDRGLVPPERIAPGAHSELEGERRVVGVWRTPDPPGLFTPAPDFAHRIWYSRDVSSVASASGVRLGEPVLVEADSEPNPGGWPLGGQTVVSFPNDHLQYAITWFLMGAALLVVYIAYHVSCGRLGWKARGPVEPGP
jgi:surfeit locus 1 family protein